MNALDLREKSVDDLQQHLLSLLNDQFKYRMQKATGQLPQTHLIGQVRKDIARVKTVLRERTGA